MMIAFVAAIRNLPERKRKAVRGRKRKAKRSLRTPASVTDGEAEALEGCMFWPLLEKIELTRGRWAIPFPDLNLRA
jgi:hypothetical protein